jgi:hypothetical protein
MQGQEMFRVLNEKVNQQIKVGSDEAAANAKWT